MRTHFLFATALLLLVTSATESPAQQGWKVDTVNRKSLSLLTGVEFTSANAGVIVGDTTLKTTDGGRHWLPLGSAIGWYGQRYGFAAVHCFDSTNWVGVGATSFVTANAGQTWTFDSLHALYAYSTNFWAVEFVGNEGLASGQNSTIAHSIDGGVTWGIVSNSVYGPPALTYLGIASAGPAWIIVGGNPNYSVPWGVIIRSTDNGASWDTVLHTNNRVVTAVSFPNALVGYATADSVYHTTDGGATWKGVHPIGAKGADSVTIGSISGVSFKDPLVGTLVGSGGRIYRTRDGGAHWTLQTSNTPVDLRAVCFVDTARGWAVGYLDRVVRTTNGGWGPLISVDDQSSKVPYAYSLLQNYPNPVNPTTKIQFTVVNQQLTTVKVFDVLGRDVTTLVNEVKEPGTYTVEWNASGLASGTYFYRMTAGGFVAVKKLLLLR